MRGRGERRRRPHHRSPRQAAARHQERHARRGLGQGQGRDHLGRRGRRRARRSAAVRAPVQGSAPRRRRRGLFDQPERRQPEGDERLRRTVTDQRRRDRSQGR